MRVHDMITVESKLKLISSDVLESNITFNPSELSQHESFSKMKVLPVDIDFDVKMSKEGAMFVFTNVEINNDDDANFGYSIFVAGATSFSFAEDMDENERQSFIGSAVNISITNLRNYINNATSYYPLGSFSFHSIDMNALFEAKSNQEKKD